MAALNPPVDRRLLLAKLEEEVFIDDRQVSLFCSETVDGYSGRGFAYLHHFRRYPLPAYVYQIDDVLLEKEIMLVYGENTVQVRYRVMNENHRRVRLVIYPLITCRDYHWTTRRTGWPWHKQSFEQGMRVEAFDGAPPLYLTGDYARCVPENFWYDHVFYEAEAFRGLDSVEDLYCPARFEIRLEDSKTFWLAASTREVDMRADLPAQRRRKHLQRVRSLLEQQGSHHDHQRILTLAADDFLVHRDSTGEPTVIAGYPWFTDWGRDAMLALPGLTLPTRRFGDCRDVLRGFAQYEKDGLIPNVFADDTGAPAYNTADASLWMFWAVYKYLQYTRDYQFAAEMYSVLSRIAERYAGGTRFHIRMEDDGLIDQGEEGTALTWMDAKVNGHAVTPRRGKPVEINALWHFALRFLSYLARHLGHRHRAGEWTVMADQVHSSFNRQFWVEQGGYLCDTIDENGGNQAFRCNQIFAVSLPGRLLDAGRARAVTAAVWQRLYTPCGLRTLDCGGSGYSGKYAGGQRERDTAYHQGTVWVWPWGHFADAVRQTGVSDQESRRMIARMTVPLLAHLFDAGLGSVSEVFDGDSPHTPGGCIAQAWSVAELLRVLHEMVDGNVRNIELDGPKSAD